MDDREAELMEREKTIRPTVDRTWRAATLAALALLLLALPMLSATLEVSVRGHTPPNPVNTTSFVNVSTITRCNGGPCASPPPDAYTLLAIRTASEGGNSIQVQLDQEINITYICNSYISCRQRSETVYLVAQMLDGNGVVIDRSGEVEAGLIYTWATNEVPAIAWATNPSMSGNQVKIQLLINDTDDLPARLTYTVDANENGQGSTYPGGAGWALDSQDSSDHTLSVRLTYTCAGSSCALPLSLGAKATDPSGAQSASIDYTFRAQTAPSPPANIICAGELNSNSRWMEVTTEQINNISRVKTHRYARHASPGGSDYTDLAADYDSVSGISHAHWIGVDLSSAQNLTVSAQAVWGSLNSTWINCTYLINSTSLPVPDTPQVVITPGGPYNYTSVLTATASSAPGQISAHYYHWRLRYANGTYGGGLEEMQATNAVSSSTYDCLAHGCGGGDTLVLEVFALNGSVQNDTPYRAELPISGPALDEDPYIYSIDPTEPIDVSGTVSVEADARQLLTGTLAVRHRYTWTYGTNLNQTDTRDLTNRESEDTFLCDALRCGSGLSLQVEAINASDGVIGVSRREILIAGLDYSLEAPVLQTYPRSPADNASFLLFASNGAQGVDRHIYAWVSDNGLLSGTLAAAADPQTNQSNATIPCTASTCRGACITAVVYAELAGARSPASTLTICPNAPPLDYRPEAKDFVFSQTGLSDLNQTGSTLIDANKSYTLTVGAPDGDPDFDMYYYALTGNTNTPYFQNRSANPSGDLALPLTCIGCVPGEWITARIIGQRAGANSSERVYTFTVPRSSTAAQMEGICEAGWLNRWLPLMGIAWAGLIAFIAFVYMLGSALHIPQFLDWSKTEIGQILLGVGMLVVILWLMGLQCNLRIGEFAAWGGIDLTHGIGGGQYVNTQAGSNIAPTDTMMDAAIKGLEWSMTQTHLTIALMRYQLGILNIRATFSQSATEYPGIGGLGISFSPLAGDWTAMGSLQMLLNLNTTFLLALLFQYFSLAIFSASSGLFLFLVPIGLILRCMPYLRGFGGALAALGIGFYIFYPMYLALIGVMLPPIYAGMPSVASLSGFNSVDQLVGAEYGITGTSITSYFYSMPELPDQLRAAGVENPDDCSDYGRCFYAINLAPLFELTALNFLRAVLLPAAGLLVIVSLVRDLSAIFGDELDASKLMQMV